MHVLGWSVVSSQRGACLWKDLCWVWCISLAMSLGCVRICPCEFFRQSNELTFIGWNIFLWMVLGFKFSRALYFVMAF